MTCTIFKNLADKTNPHSITLDACLNRIRDGASADKVLEIREKVFAGEDVSQAKKSLPFVVFAAGSVEEGSDSKGNATYRLDECVSTHSGVFVLDFDHTEVELKLQQLEEDPYIYAAWVSPSGDGVKALVRCPPSIENHSLYYTAFLDRYPELDPTSKNISRGTFESYDPDIYINENALVWDKKLSEEERRANKEKSANRRGTKVLATAVSMVRASYDGTKHAALRDAAILLGGYIATGRVDESEAIKLLVDEISLKNPKDIGQARKTIEDGIAYGKARPLAESKKIEKAQQFLRREDGTYDFEADNEEMTEYEQAVLNGTLEFGLPTGFNRLNQYWMFKKHTIVWFGGIDNTGKSFLVWYFAVLAAKFHNWKVCIQSAENNDGELRKKLKEFFLNKSIKIASDEELAKADQFVKKHFRIISAKNLHSVEDFLIKAEILYDEGFEFDVLVGEPWNSFDIPANMDMYRNNLHALNLLRVFKENYSAVWICDHVSTTAARNRDKDGFVKVPWKSDIEYGQLKCNKSDDFIIIHRLVNHPELKHQTQIHVNKIKSRETGGEPTENDDPVIVVLNPDFCGYSCNSQDPMKHRLL